MITKPLVLAPATPTPQVFVQLPYPCSRYYTDINLITDLITNFGIASMLNHTMNFVTKLGFMVWFKSEINPKSDIKSVTKSDIRIWNSFHVKPYHKS